MASAEINTVYKLVGGDVVIIYAGNEIPVGATPWTPPDPTPAELAADKAAALVKFRTLRIPVLDALAGIAGRAQRAGLAADAAACDYAATALLNITSDAGVIAATDGPSTTLAVLNCYRAIAAQLAATSPTSINAFDSLELTL